jgi:glycine cleavage system aminomethyltransferase T
MRTYPKIDEREIAEKKRMRPLWTYLKGLAATATDVVSGHGSDVGHWMNQNGFVYADLKALRMRPRHYDVFTADKWEWFLHRVMNDFSEQITTAIAKATVL